MSGITNTMGYPLQLDKTIDKMFYAQMRRRKRYYEMLFKSSDAPKGGEYTEATLSELGLLRELPEGRGVEFDVPNEGNRITRFYIPYGLGTQITKIMLQDDLHEKVKQVPTELADSAIERTEFVGATVLESGFTGGTSVAEDGNPLFFATHRSLKGAVTINNLGSTDMTPSALEAAFSYGDTLVGENGFIRPVRPLAVVCHPSQKWVVNDILKSTGRVWDYNRRGSGDVLAGSGGPAGFPAAEAINLMNPKHGIVDDWKVILNPYFTDQDAWFVLFEDYDLRMLWKERPVLESSGDFATGNKVYKVTMRFSAFSNKYQRMWGSPGA